MLEGSWEIRLKLFLEHTFQVQHVQKDVCIIHNICIIQDGKMLAHCLYIRVLQYKRECSDCFRNHEESSKDRSKWVQSEGEK